MGNVVAGQRINEYVIDDLIGNGAFGAVWRAHHHLSPGQAVAIKIPADQDYINHLQLEGITVHGLNHPNIVRAIGLDLFHNPPYLVMEYVPGTSLRPLIQQRRLSPQHAVAILRQVLAGLAAAHRRGMIHGDLKPENILIDTRALTAGLSADGVVKISDFGLGRAAAQAMLGSIEISRVNWDRSIAATLDHMAPEQRKGADADVRADLYACGILLYEMLTGELPEGMELPSTRNPQSPVYLDEVFKRAYARLDKRFATTAEFAEALNPPAILTVDVPPAPAVRPAEAATTPIQIFLEPGETTLPAGPALENRRTVIPPVPAPSTVAPLPPSWRAAATPPLPVHAMAPPPLPLPAPRQRSPRRYFAWACFITLALICVGITVLWVRSTTKVDELRYVTAAGTQFSLATHPHGADYSVTRDSPWWPKCGLSLHSDSYGDNIVDPPDVTSTDQSPNPFTMTVPDPPARGQFGFRWDRSIPSYRTYWAPMWFLLLLFAAYPLWFLARLTWKVISAPDRK